MVDQSEEWAETCSLWITPGVIGHTGFEGEEGPRVEVVVREDVDAETSESFVEDRDIFVETEDLAEVGIVMGS